MHESPPLLHGSPDTRLTLHTAGAYAAPEGRHFPPHQHPTWEMVYYRSGRIRCPVGERTYTAVPGTLLLTPPRTVHAEIADTAYSNFFAAVDAPPDHPWPSHCVDDADGTVGAVFAALVREWNGTGADREEMMALLLRQLDLLLQRGGERERVTEGERLVRAAERLLEERFASPVRIADIAREVGAAPSSLRAHFTARRGTTPSAYLQALRVQQALALIRSSDLSLEAIAGLCGFDSASHLSRHVRRSSGRTPGSFRRSP